MEEKKKKAQTPEETAQALSDLAKSWKKWTRPRASSERP